MYSVILPTMWRGIELEMMLPLVANHPLVGEVIIIDNNPTQRPSWYQPHPKIQLLEQSTNIYVNPAWNLGASLAKHEWLCFMSDDVLFDEHVFDFLDNKSPGIIGLRSVDMYKLWEGRSMEDNIASTISPNMDLEEIAGLLPGDFPLGFAVLFFVHKSHWMRIPTEQLKILFGDVWLYRLCELYYKIKPRWLIDYHVVGHQSTTTHSPEFQAMVFEELLNGDDILNKSFGLFQG